MQLDRNLEEANEYRRKLDLSGRDSKRLQDDLLTVTRENQVSKENLSFQFYRILFIIIFINKILNINRQNNDIE